MREKSDAEREPKKKRVDLSVPQVAGSAVAAVVAAKLASYFGVYGTILGAGVVSAIATCGGTVFQHFFKRTGEQIRDVTVQAKPKTQQAAALGEFTEGTVYRARVKSWKRPVVAAALVFGVTMAGITTYELVSGQSFSGDGRSTTVSDAFKSSGSGSDSERSEPGTTPSTGSSSREPSSSGGSAAPQDDRDSGTSPTPTPRSSASSAAEAGDATPTPTAGAPTSPAPDASSHSQSADPGRVDPSGQ
ncbi:hypothetical protein GCM10011579_049550 [Streptomyces albiflavescens]|uniref:Uncharacterized protein n=1 Tax=Streptomyces albiflavescens TaxID=1623582 RepID=A0A917Y6E2_9ACTN|nr:hypothetical protein [Streptomyces albiflavescens]GGN72398.1 hypothetical protein GCM10011579_049550 [Streptomyces albiflavescens]